MSAPAVPPLKGARILDEVSKLYESVGFRSPFVGTPVLSYGTAWFYWDSRKGWRMSNGYLRGAQLAAWTRWARKTANGTKPS